MWDARVLRSSSGNSTYEMVDLRCCRLWVFQMWEGIEGAGGSVSLNHLQRDR